MKAKARTLYLDNQTYKKLALLAGLKKTSRSSFVRILINDEFYQGLDGNALRRAPSPKKLDRD